jgi:hypothetical protein
VPPILTKKEREFVEDWLKVVKGKMDKLEFYKKWSTKKDDRSFLEDFEKVKAGEMSLEEFKRKWTRKGDWKNYVRVMRHRLEKKRKNLKRILKEIDEEIKLLREFFNCEKLP